MEIKNYNGTFDIRKGDTLDVELTNPIVSEQGSMSLPYSFIRTPNNEKLLGFPARYERKKAYELGQEMNIRAGIFNENARFQLESMQSKDIEGTFYLFESIFYSQVKEVKLPTIFEGVERHFVSSDKVADVVELFEKKINSAIDPKDEFGIFPVAITAEERTHGLNNPAFDAEDILNEVELVERSYKLKAASEQTYKDSDENEITLPVGYGISPFLKFRYILRKVFEYFGLELEENFFDTDPYYSNLCVLNNTMDAVLKGFAYENQLVPDCDVNDFLDVVRGMCGDFYIDTVHKKVRLIFFDDIVDAVPDMDLTPYLTAPFDTINYQVPTQIRLTVNTGLPLAAPASDTYEDFILKFPEHRGTPVYVTQNEAGVYFYNGINAVYKAVDPVSLDWAYTRIKFTRLGSLTFNYDGNDAIEKKEVNIPAEIPAIVNIPCGMLTGYEQFVFAPLIGSKRNLNSRIILDQNIIEEEKVESPLAICFEYYNPTLAYRYGSISYEKDWYKMVLSPWGDEYMGYTGFFDKFWKKYDAIIRTSFHTIIYRMRMPAAVLHNFRFDRLKSVNGQPLLPVALRYSLTDDPFIDIEFEGRTVKEYI